MLWFLSGFKNAQEVHFFWVSSNISYLISHHCGGRKVVMNPNQFRVFFSYTVPHRYTWGLEADMGQGGVVVGWKASR